VIILHSYVDSTELIGLKSGKLVGEFFINTL